MQDNRLVRAIGNVDDKYIMEASTFRKAKRKIVAWPMMAAVACLCLVLGGAYGYNYRNVEYSVVDIDINPSIELSLSKAQTVVSVQALNDDAAAVLEDLELEGMDVDAALEIILEALAENGYLDSVYSAINVCVENDDEEVSAQVSAKLEQEIEELLAERDIIGDVETQTTTSDEELAALAESYGVSIGKLSLAMEISESVGITLEEALALSVEELWELIDVESVDDAELLSKEDALAIAYAELNLEETDSVVVKTKIEENDGAYVYRIVVLVNGSEEYTYKIDAVEGTVLESTQTTVEPELRPEDAREELLTKNELLELICEQAGVEKSEIRLLKFRLVKGDVPTYVIVFEADGMEYSYSVDATTAEVLSEETREVVMPERKHGRKKDKREFSGDVSDGDARPGEREPGAVSGGDAKPERRDPGAVSDGDVRPEGNQGGRPNGKNPGDVSGGDMVPDGRPGAGGNGARPGDVSDGNAKPDEKRPGGVTPDGNDKKPQGQPGDQNNGGGATGPEGQNNGSGATGPEGQNNGGGATGPEGQNNGGGAAGPEGQNNGGGATGPEGQNNGGGAAGPEGQNNGSGATGPEGQNNQGGAAGPGSTNNQSNVNGWGGVGNAGLTGGQPQANNSNSR